MVQRTPRSDHFPTLLSTDVLRHPSNVALYADRVENSLNYPLIIHTGWRRSVESAIRAFNCFAGILSPNSATLRIRWEPLRQDRQSRCSELVTPDSVYITDWRDSNNQ